MSWIELVITHVCASLEPVCDFTTRHHTEYCNILLLTSKFHTCRTFKFSFVLNTLFSFLSVPQVPFSRALQIRV